MRLSGAVAPLTSRVFGSEGVRSLRVPPRFACFVVSTGFVTRLALSEVPAAPPPSTLPPPLPHAASKAAAVAVAPARASARRLLIASRLNPDQYVGSISPSHRSE